MFQYQWVEKKEWKDNAFITFLTNKVETWRYSKTKLNMNQINSFLNIYTFTL